MKEFFKDWKVHALCLALTVAAEFIGIKKFALGPIKFSLLPMLYALIFGVLLAISKLIKPETMKTASPYIGISVMLLTVKMGAAIGPNLKELAKAGPALVLQEFGNLGTLIIALPVAVFIFKMGRTAVGCSFSISREGSLAIIGDVYGLDSPEGQGVMGGYITGTVLGTVFNGLLVSLLISLGIFHPFALAMAAGTGSASMMSAALAPIVEAFPEMSREITAYASTSNMLTGVDDMYMGLFVALPVANRLYKKFTKKRMAKEKKNEEIIIENKLVQEECNHV